MRILQITHQYPPHHIGGTEHVAQSLAEALSARGHAVSVVTRAPVPAPTRDVEGSVVVHRLPEAASPRARFLASFGDAAASAAFREVLDEAKPDVAHAQHVMGWPLGNAAELGRRRIALAITLHDYAFACANAQLVTNDTGARCDGPRGANCGRCAAARAGIPAALIGPAGAALAPLMMRRNREMRRLLASAAGVFAPSRYVIDWFNGHDFDTAGWGVVENAVDMPADLPDLTDPKAGFRALYAGGLAWQKGAHVLIEAFNRMPPDAALDVAGDPSAFPGYADGLRALAAHPGIRFVGALSRDAMWAALARSDAVVVPSLWAETSSLIAREALAAGCRVVVSRAGALETLVRAHPDRAALVEPGDADGLHRALLEARIARAPRRRVAMPAWDDYAASVERVYAAIARTAMRDHEH